jgi:hypothetical protein
VSILESVFRPLRFAWAGLLLMGGVTLAGAHRDWSFAAQLPAEYLPWTALAFAIGIAWGLAAALLLVVRHGVVLGLLLTVAAAALASADQTGMLAEVSDPPSLQRTALVLAALGAAVLVPSLVLARRQRPRDAREAVGRSRPAQDPAAARDALALANLDRLSPEEANVLAWCSAYTQGGRFVGSIDNSPILASLHAKGILDYSSADRQSFVLVVRPVVWAEVRDLGHVLASRGTAIPRDPPFRYGPAFAR